MNRMELVTMALRGDTWRLTYKDRAGHLHSYRMKRQGSETLADAAVRLEDVVLEARKGLVKPLSAV